MYFEPGPSDQDLFNELSFYTLQLRDAAFIHQHIVDAFAVQHADAITKPMAIVLGLIGLYLYLEKNFTGRQVQRAHMRLARFRRQWVAPSIPAQRAAIGVADVLAAEPGPARNAMIRRWCEDVWEDWRECRPLIVALVHRDLGIAP
jgi:hypothetical protein